VIGVVATLQIKEDKQAEFEQVMRDLAAKVLANEAGCRHYQLCRSKKPGTYVVMERYQDDEAFRAHSQTDYFKAAAARMAPCFAGAPNIEVLEEID
jgi:quinol monooxygenase YgiN